MLTLVNHGDDAEVPWKRQPELRCGQKPKDIDVRVVKLCQMVGILWAELPGPVGA